MDELSEPKTEADPPPPSAASPVTGPAHIPVVMALLMFGFGAAAGLLLAFSGFGFLEDSGAIIVTVFMSALVVVAVLGVILLAFRRRLWIKLFGVAETQLEMFAAPLARVAENALDRNPGGATAAARELVQLVLARYSWLTARRWLIASLTGLIAAMAALAGTALLFKQNQLLAVQSELLREQNLRIQEQSGLLAQDVQLAEAARNAALAVEITNIAAMVGKVAERTRAAMNAATSDSGDALRQVDRFTPMVNDLDATELGQELTLRIVSASRAARPYLFLDLGYRAEDSDDKIRVAMTRRRGDLPQTYASLAAARGWQDQSSQNQLVDRPASPERGELLRVLIAGGVRNLEPLNFSGLDLSFAYMQDAEIAMLTAQGALLSYADFSGSHITEAALGGAYLENARFRNCRIERSSFADVTAGQVRPPYRPEDAPAPSFLAGADFAGSVLVDVDFTEADLLAANFDGALMVRPDFANAVLGAATLRGAVLMAPHFDGAYLKSVDFDGAVVFGDGFLEQLRQTALPESFIAARYEVVPLTDAEVMAVTIVYVTLEPEEVAEITDGAPAFQIKRIRPFED